MAIEFAIYVLFKRNPEFVTKSVETIVRKQNVENIEKIVWKAMNKYNSFI